MNRTIDGTMAGIVLAVAICATMVAPAMAQEPASPFLINGYVYNSDGDPCNDPIVRIMNTSTGTGWDATNNSTSNYYQLVLDSDNVSENDVLQINISGCTESRTITHTVAAEEIDCGGLMVFDPMIISCNSTGAEQNEFYPGDNVSVRGTGLAPNTNYTLWIQDDPVNDSEALDTSEDQSGSQENVTTDENGDFGPKLIWINISAGSPKNYDIVVDNLDGTYNEASDGIDSASTEVGFTAPIPELPGVVLVSIGLLGLAGLVWRRKDE